MFGIKMKLAWVRNRRRHRQQRARYKPVVYQLEGRLVPSTFHEFPVAPLGSQRIDAISDVAGITAGPDGNLWFTDTQQNLIGQITPDGSVTEFAVPRPLSNPVAITVGPDGNLWFAATDLLGGGIGRITPDGSFAEFPIAAERGADGITAGPDGNIWFTQFDYGLSAGLVGRLTPNGQITDFPVPQTASGSDDRGITTGPDGTLWFEVNGGVRHITPDGQLSDVVAPFGDSITVGADGNIWTSGRRFDLQTGRPLNAVIERITLDGTISEFTLPTTERGPLGITAGPDGNIWFTEPDSDKIGMITPDGSITEFQVPELNSHPAGITAGPDGNIWFTELGTDRIGELVLNDGTGPAATSRSFPALAQALRATAVDAVFTGTHLDAVSEVSGQPAVAPLDPATSVHLSPDFTSPQIQPMAAGVSGLHHHPAHGTDAADITGRAGPLAIDLLVVV